MRTKTYATLTLTMLIVAFIMPFTLNNVNAYTTTNYIIKPDGKVYDGPTEVQGVFDVSDSIYTLLSSFSGSVMVQKGDIVIDGAGFTITGPGAGSGYAIRIESVNNVTITNFNLDSAGSLIELVNSENSNINACNLTNGVGTWLDNSNHTVITRNTLSSPSSSDSGMLIRNSGYNNITENTVSYASNGIGIDTTLSSDVTADYNIIFNNTVSHCLNAGIAIQNKASFNNVTNNNLTDCNNALYLQGSYNMVPYYPYNNTMADNIAENSRSGVYAGSAPYTTIKGNLIYIASDYGISISDSFSGTEQNCITISDNLLFNCSWGMSIMTSNTSITGNIVMGSETEWGIYMQSNNNTVIGNIFESSTNHAIMVAECSDNVIYHNDFLQENVNNAYYDASENIWDNGYPSGGNYWSAAKTPVDNFSGVDQNVPGSDDIIDTVLELGPSNVDYYPLVYPAVLRMLNVSFVGNGTVDDGITLHYPGQQVTVGATPDEGYDLVHWLLDGQYTTGNPLQVNMNSNHNLTAIFGTLPTEYTLTVQTASHGTTNATGVQTYDIDANVTVTATADSGYMFSRWVLDAQNVTGNPLTVTMNANHTITPIFESAPIQNYTLTVNINGQGAVQPNGGVYASGTTVNLTATAEQGWIFSGWSGAAQGTSAIKSIIMNSNKTVTATFTQIVLPPPTYSVIFTQTGLVDEANWIVTFEGITKTASTSTISFDGYQDGNYQYTITLPQGYVTSHALSGAVAVNGQDAIRAIAFAKLYPVVFAAPDLPTGAQWTVTLNGETQTSNGSITFELTGGTYSYTITLPTGYVSSASLTGTLTVSATTQPVTIPTTPESTPTQTPTPTATPTATPTQTPTPTPTPIPQPNGNLTIIQPVGGQTATSPYTSTSGIQQVTVTATPDQGYIFAYWLLDGQRIEGNNTLTLPANEQHSLQAIFQASAQMTPTQTPQLNSFTVPVLAAVAVIVGILLLMVMQRRRKKENKQN